MKRANTRKQIYRSHVKRSQCRGRKVSECTRKFGCKRTKGTKRKFCRKLKSRRIGYVREASLIN